VAINVVRFLRNSDRGMGGPVWGGDEVESGRRSNPALKFSIIPMQSCEEVIFAF